MTDRKFTPPTEYPTEYVTSDGRKAKIIAKINNPGREYVCVISESDGTERVGFYCQDGSWCFDTLETNADLFDKPETVTRWHNVYQWGLSAGYRSRESCDRLAGVDRLNVLRITTCKKTGKLIECVEEDV